MTLLGLTTDDAITLIQRGNEYRVEVDGPDPVVGFLQTDMLIDQRVGDVEQLVLEAKRSAGRDLLDDQVARSALVFARHFGDYAAVSCRIIPTGVVCDGCSTVLTLRFCGSRFPGDGELRRSGADL